MPPAVQDKNLRDLTTIEEEKRREYPPKNPFTLDALKDSRQASNINFNLQKL